LGHVSGSPEVGLTLGRPCTRETAPRVPRRLCQADFRRRRPPTVTNYLRRESSSWKSTGSRFAICSGLHAANQVDHRDAACSAPSKSRARQGFEFAAARCTRARRRPLADLADGLSVWLSVGRKGQCWTVRLVGAVRRLLLTTDPAVRVSLLLICRPPDRCTTQWCRPDRQ
jgi:hypothetical protein